MTLFEPFVWELEEDIRRTIAHLKDLVHKFPNEMRARRAKAEVFRGIEDLQENVTDLIEQSKRGSESCRIATWDLNNLSKQNMKYEKRIGSISDTILYYQFDLITFQGVDDVDALTDLMKSLNRGRGQPWKTKWCDVHSSEQDGYTEKMGFIWNNSHVPIQGPIRFTHYHDFDEIKRRPVSLEFFLGECKMELINFHLRSINSKATKLKNQQEINAIHEILKLSRETTKGEYYIILLGNFNCCPGRPAFTRHQCVFDKEVTSTMKNKYCDNILVEKEVARYIKRRHVAEIRTQAGIEADEVSDHFPIWVDLEYPEHQILDIKMKSTTL